MNLKWMTGLGAAVAALSLAPAVASAKSNLTCGPDAKGYGVEVTDYSFGRVECLSLTDMDYTVSLDVTVQFYFADSGWEDSWWCDHGKATATAVNGVAVAATQPTGCFYGIGYPGIEFVPHRARAVVTESLDSDVRTAYSDTWVPHIEIGDTKLNGRRR
jgi:hypothetical protein